MTSTDNTPFNPPGTPGYAEATASFQLAAPVDPAGAFTARSIDDVVRAVAVARHVSRPLLLNTTGHAMGRTAPLTDSLVLHPLLDQPLRVDPDTRTARVPAGKTWGDILPEITRYGLTALHGSSSGVGVIGYLLGGGISFYGRRFGLAANSIRSLTVVLADGDVVEASGTHRPDLFWALRGGGGGFGVVVEAQIDLVPMHRVLTGMTVWDPADAARLAPAWQTWARDAPPEITTSFRMLSLPPLPGLPPYLAGKRVIALDGAVTASAESDLPAAQRILDEMLSPLSALAQPVADTWAVASPQALPLTHLDPLQPVAFESDSALIQEIDTSDWARALEAGPSLTAFELRQLGGAFAVPASNGGALDHLTAPLLYHGVGLAGEETARDLKAVRAAIQPFVTGYTAPNFVDHFTQRQRTYDDRTRVRVERVRLAVDPTGLFAGDAAPTRD
ncbi:FAD-dependent oxidoreductase [Streptomyces sp. NPDC101152]|uniref:FAD-dependent oxidoreductase n=1 Tax=Streptomyces sp. NPDC101152 TaxID=3366116 RepID=UPI0038263229